MRMTDYSIVIPAYNEEDRIEKTLDLYVGYFEMQYPRYEIIVVCDGCSDKTVEIVARYAEKNPKVKKIEYSDRMGKGSAIRTGLKQANGEIIGFVDADDAFEITHLKNVFNAIENEGYDCVTASKWKNFSFWEVTEPFFRKILSRIWNLLMRYWMGLNFHDTQAGLKFFTKNAWEGIQDECNCRGFEFDVELLWRLQRKNYKIIELSIPSKFQEGTSFRIKYCIEMLVNTVKMRYE